jgi:urease accessory protein
VTQCLATAPLKILVPRRSSGAAHLVLSSYGGGLVAGDHLAVNFTVEPQAAAVLTTQASTKVYHAQDGRGSSQTLDARLAADSLLVVAPDPVVCFKDAIYSQRQSFQLEADASLALLETYTAGRWANGEQWAFSRFDSCNRIVVSDRETVFDRVVLTTHDVLRHSQLATGRFTVFASLYLVGPRLSAGRDIAARALADLPIDPAADCFMSYSPIDQQAGVLRIAAGDAATIRERCSTVLAPLAFVLGGLPWDRRY